MHFPQLWRTGAALILATCFAGAQSSPAEQVTTDSTEVQVTSVPEDMPSSWFHRLWQGPLMWLFPPTVELGVVSLPAPLPPPCMIEPLVHIEDAQSLAFEAQAQGGGVVDLDGLQPGASRALSRFESVVEQVGGRMLLTSAYRPATYQAHLQNVWDKWMVELRNDVRPECSSLRTEVAAEFTRHQLLESQRPVAYSDHTKGVGVDAAVVLPRNARWGRRRVGIDALARLAGFRRPDIGRDPVHFRFVAGI